MAAIDFPDSPSVNDTFTVGSKTWTWNGSYWISDEAATGLDGLNDVTITSPVDGDVVQYDNGEFVNSPVDYTDLTSVPNNFTPSAHTHTKSEVTDFTHASSHESGGTDELTIDASQIVNLELATGFETNFLLMGS